MTIDTRSILLEEIVRIAPDIDLAAIRDGDHLQQDLELDSMDFLNLASALCKRLGIEIPEVDYPKLATVGAAAAFLSKAAARSAV